MDEQEFYESLKAISNYQILINNQFIKVIQYFYDNEILNDDYLEQYYNCCVYANNPKIFMEFINDPPDDIQQGNTYKVDQVIKNQKKI